MAALNEGPGLWAALRTAVVAAACALVACSSAPRPPAIAVLLVGGSAVQDAGGQVQVVRGEAASAARRGEALETGDVVRTGPDGRAVLRLDDGRVEVIVFENSEVRIGSIFVALGEVVVRVLKKVKDEFRAESEYAVATPETTEFLVAFGPDRDYRCAVIEGRVEVRSPKGEWPRATLSRGEVAIGRAGRPVEERALDSQEYNALVERVNAVERAYRPTSARLVVPDVTGFDERGARRMLATAGFEVGPSEGRVTGRARVGTVLEQSPPAGSRLSAGGEVGLVVAVEPTTVPRVTGLPLADAEARLAAARLRTGEVRREITGARPPGEVLRQQPPPAQEVAVGSGVDLWVEAPSVVVPSVRDVDARRAAAVLRQAGLQARGETRLVEGVADGIVLAQRPEPGTPVKPGTVVELIIAERGVRVPDLIGSSQRTLKVSLERRGLAIGQASSRPERRPPGTVVDQRPAPGTLVRAGTPVDIVVAAAYCTVPEVRRLTRKEAIAAITAANLHWSITAFEQGPHPRGASPDDRVATQKPAAGTRVECGSMVTLTVY